MQWREWRTSTTHTLAAQISRWLEIVQSGGEQARYLSSCDMHEEWVRLLLRSGTNGVQGPCMTVATVQIEPEAQRAGLFKDLLAHLWKVNPWPMLVVEDVTNPSLQAFLERIGAQVLSERYATTYAVPSDSIYRFSARHLLPYSAYRRTLQGGAQIER
ncbi:hypothetical protein [Roseateles sp. LYH14W]|uniref:N-acetyltransferase n=1 Tax=Pelomonas parva TaxID=3299032 RepID=A0ABW7F1E6_9BURK